MTEPEKTPETPRWDRSGRYAVLYEGTWHTLFHDSMMVALCRCDDEHHYPRNWMHAADANNLQALADEYKAKNLELEEEIAQLRPSVVE